MDGTRLKTADSTMHHNFISLNFPIRSRLVPPTVYIALSMLILTMSIGHAIHQQIGTNVKKIFD